MDPVALFNGLVFDLCKNTWGDGAIACLDIGADSTILIITDGVRIWNRVLPIGGNDFTLALASGLSLTFAEAEQLKRSAAPETTFDMLEPALAALVQEIERSITFYSSVNHSARVARIVALGNGHKLAGLWPYLQERLGREVERVASFARLTGDNVIQSPRFQENLGSFAVCYGLGLQGLGLAAIRTNMLPPEVRPVRGWSPHAVLDRVQRLLPNGRRARDAFETPRESPVWTLPPRKPLPMKVLRCPKCHGVGLTPNPDNCRLCGWEGYPGANRETWGQVGNCPRCGFSYRWDGAKCYHCEWPAIRGRVES
ncbi:MAG: Competence protein [Planctomycetota bacterium]|nr:Competence protein [Planctomycetota bacterium]